MPRLAGWRHGASQTPAGGADCWGGCPRTTCGGCGDSAPMGGGLARAGSPEATCCQ